jgi:uncharacterized membrane protein YtjA (UPF0391 family)
MLGLVITLFIVSIIAAIFGYTGIAVATAEVAKIIFFIFIILFVISLVYYLIAGRRPPPPP